ncbi:hypothetical protein VNO80_25916 [Phaseolus coccineus]|uniref:Bet v I/Major latex protein domain-containing protein n=1 Tax=Phaseolus coccineus TaxID=3886 RepID=A0AAN9LVI4_PHACN
MSLTGKISTELPVHAAAEKWFHTYTNQLHHIQHVTDKVHASKLHEGDDWHANDSVKHWTYTVGFQMESVKLTYVAPSRTMKATGERQIQGTKWYQFDQSYPIPDYCEPEKVLAKFETPVLTLTMPKKATSQAPPKQQVQTSQVKGVEAEPKLDEKLQDGTTTPPSTTTTKVEEPTQGKKSVSPQPTTTLEDTSSQIPSEPFKGRMGQEEAVERVGPSGENQMGEKELEAKPTPTRAASLHGDEKIQKGQIEIESKPAPTRTTTMQRDEKIQKGQEIESKPTPTVPTKMERDEKPQKGREEFEPKATSTMAPIRKLECVFSPNIKTDEQPTKGQEEDKPKPDITNVTRKTTVKEQLEEEKTEETRDEDSEETSDEDEEKERITKEDKKEPSKSRKSVKDKEQTDFGEKETKTEKILAKEAETSAPKVQKEKEKQSNNKTSLKKKGKSEGNAMERVGFVSHVFTKFAEWTLNKEEKKLAAKIGAAVLVIAALCIL